jgi:hypothetical protein
MGDQQVTYRILLTFLLMLLPMLPSVPAYIQTSTSADVAAYQLGVIAEVRPGTDLTYVITVTNHGPSVVNEFYILDGWTVNAAGISGFAAPIADPDFGAFTLVGTWMQERPDQSVLAWLLQGDLNPGDTIEFNWSVRVDNAYRGGLINWARIAIGEELTGTWQPRTPHTAATPPVLASLPDPIPENNRTTDEVTVVTEAPTTDGVDLALYQAGLLTQLPVGAPLDSTWLVTNRGPQVLKQFYVLAGWSLNADGGTVLSQPITDPDFGNFKVVGRWLQMREDEELWLWQLEGELPAGNNASFRWVRQIDPAYRGDIVNWARVFVHDVPGGEWTPRDGTTATPQPLANAADAAPDNDRSVDGLTTIIE